MIRKLMKWLHLIDQCDHEWTRWGEPKVCASYPLAQTQGRVCTACGKVQTRRCGETVYPDSSTRGAMKP